jgi:hypothetical protein
MVARRKRGRVRAVWDPPGREPLRLVCAHCGGSLQVEQFVVAEVGGGLRVRCSHRCLAGFDLEGSGHSVRRAEGDEITRRRYG